ncbi:MAG: Shikimate dehydrogenase [Verrucomicrobiaceae bacterium]|nr:Shikimate dehydrogenase [Verrucomicrobiaceae bacterium]
MISSAPLCYSLTELDHWQERQPHLAPPALLAVIGDPISHSKSPQMHNPALAACGIDAQYIRVQVPVGRVAEALRTFVQQGFRGINVTIPHKFEALDAVDVIDPLAQVLGAVNTVAIDEDGQLHGYNTDGPGFLRSVKEAFGVEVRDLRVLILGAGGGAGRAVAVQCALENCQHLVLLNRTRTKVEQLAGEIETLGTTPTTIVDWTDESLLAVLSEVDLIVNGTSLGMKVDDAPLLPAGALTDKHLVFDMVYRPGGQLTSLGEAAREAGARYVDGATLLLHQGAISFEHWFQRPAPLDAMRAGLASALIA